MPSTLSAWLQVLHLQKSLKNNFKLEFDRPVRMNRAVVKFWSVIADGCLLLYNRHPSKNTLAQGGIFHVYCTPGRRIGKTAF